MLRMAAQNADILSQGAAVAPSTLGVVPGKSSSVGACAQRGVQLVVRTVHGDCEKGSVCQWELDGECV
jgi:hypothetical protein